MANEIREKAKIRKKSCYSQHMTVGKFKNLDVPEEITKTQYGYKKMLAEEYLKINILTNVKVDLINEHLEQWALKFHKKNKLIFITVNLEEKYQYIMDFDANSSDDRNKLNQLINTMWQICQTMMDFVLLVDLIFRMDQTVEYLEENIWNIHIKMMSAYYSK